MSKPRILFLCQTLPFPPDGGVAIRSFNILRLLADRYEVSVLCFYRKALSPDLNASLTALRGIAQTVEAFPIEQEHSRWRMVSDHVRSVISRRVYTVATYESAAFRARLSSLVNSGAFELAHVDSLDLSAYLPMLACLPTVCVHHNIESALLRRRAAHEPSALRKAYLRLQADLMEREERVWAPKVALNITVSDDDQRALLVLAPTAKTAVVPNGVDVEKFLPTELHEAGMVFVGGMTWFPNKDALEYFAADILPLLRAAGCRESVTWVGRALPGALATFAPQGINLTGYVEDIRGYVARAACYIVPLRVGGGTRLKILDAWAMGKAIVSTSIGCEGLHARDGWNILIRDNPQEFADAVSQVLCDEAIRARLGGNGRRTVEQTYGWNVIGAGMSASYEAVRDLGVSTGCRQTAPARAG